MLMITCLVENGVTRTLKLEGKLQGPWVQEFKTACDGAEQPPCRLRLDLASLSFVDAAGVACLQELIRKGVPVVACSAFVACLLGLDAKKGSGTIYT
jgi:ABC-type transporter Mla MlaB component